jgi:hypothetical protein
MMAFLDRAGMTRLQALACLAIAPAIGAVTVLVMAALP